MKADLPFEARPGAMEIDLHALRQNYRVLRELIGPETRVIGALKGNGYGHGAGPVARVLAELGAHALSVGSLEDAHTIRAADVELPVLLFGGPLPSGFGPVLEGGFTPTVHDEASAEGISRAAKRPTGVFVKVDTGLGRLGVPVADALGFVERLAKLENIRVDGVYTHLSFHDAEGREWARACLAAFDRFLDSLDAAGIDVPVSQALASSCILAGLTSRANAVCPGYLLYGVSPVDLDLADTSAFRPVLKSITSALIHIGAGSGPGGPRRVGVLPLGLADGYRPVQPDSGASALIRGRRVPIRGVSLEYLVLDLSDFEEARVGDAVVLLGTSGDEEITIYELASWQGGSPHHVWMAFDRRLPARILGEPATISA